MDWEEFANRKGVKLYLEGKYDEALKFLRKDDDDEMMLIESIHFSRVCSPPLNLIIVIAGRKKVKFLDFLEKFYQDKFVGRLAHILKEIESKKESKNILKNVLSDIEKAFNEHEKAVALVYVGQFLRIVHRDYKAAEYIIRKAIKFLKNLINKSDKYKYHLALAFDTLGHIKANMGYYDDAIELHKNALSIFEGLRDWTQVAYSCCFLATLYWDKRDSINCFEYSEKALKLSLDYKVQYPPTLAHINAVMGHAYELFKEYEQAYIFLKKLHRYIKMLIV